MRLIDADALKDYYGKWSNNNTEFLKPEIDRYIDAQPTIDPSTLHPKGEWIGEADGYADGELVYDVWYCSECNHCIDNGTDEPDMLPNFCPNCGADMRGEDNG